MFFQFELQLISDKEKPLTQKHNACFVQNNVPRPRMKNVPFQTIACVIFSSISMQKS